MGPQGVTQIMDDLDTLGLNLDHLVVKCEQESAVVEAQNELVKARSSQGGRRTVVEHSKLGDSDSNGKVERAVGETAAMIRTLRAALEENLEEEVDLDNPVVPWMVRYAGELITRYRARQDGRSAVRKLKGYDSCQPIVEFAESVWFKALKTAHTDSKFADRWSDGIWLGSVLGTAGSIIAAKDGYVYRAGGVKRTPPEERWCAAWLKDIKGSPANPSQKSKDGSMTPYVRPNVLDQDVLRQPCAPSREPEAVARSFSITKAGVSKCEATIGCPGCRGLFRGYRDAHTDTCRQRKAEKFDSDPQKKAMIERAEARRVRATIRESERHWKQACQDPQVMQRAESAGSGVPTEGEALHVERKRIADAIGESRRSKALRPSRVMTDASKKHDHSDRARKLMAETSARMKAHKERVARLQAGMAPDVRQSTTGSSSASSGKPTPKGAPTVLGPEGSSLEQRGEKRSNSGDVD